ncbi:hypothetical protein L1887_26495 [Cichorium endivia]|nr:hypothetical protein L1887_26495 [Cichorium endivia]
MATHPPLPTSTNRRNHQHQPPSPYKISHYCLAGSAISPLSQLPLVDTTAPTSPPHKGKMCWMTKVVLFHRKASLQTKNSILLLLTRYFVEHCSHRERSLHATFRISIITSMFRRHGSSQKQQEQEHLEQQPEVKVNELKAALGPLSGRNLLYCTDACLKRYLEARNWNVDKAKKMLEETLMWRSTYKPEEICWEEIAVESETGKLFRANFHDRFGRTILIMKPGLQNTTSMDSQIRHLVYMMENAILNLPEGQEEMVWLIDFTGLSFSINVPIKTARDTISILQNHYPQRLAVAILYSPPRIFQAFWKIVKYFLDPKTFQKVKFVYPKHKESVELMKSYFDVENLPIEFGGKATMKYDHQEFSKLMIRDDAKASKFWGFDEKTVLPPESLT